MNPRNRLDAQKFNPDTPDRSNGPTRDRRRRMFRAWARQTFNNPAFPLVHTKLYYMVRGNEIATIEWVLTTPAKWARCRLAGNPRWETKRVGPLVLIAIRFDF